MSARIKTWGGWLLAAVLLGGLPAGLALWSIQQLNVPSASEILGYELAEVRRDARPVPRVYFARLPSELARISSAKERKSLFIRIMLPLILRVDDDIRADRERLLVLKRQLDAGTKLPGRDVRWIKDLAREYRVKDGNIDELLRRVDVIPPSLALAQAAIESGWGTSRFAQQTNALFGQWTYGSDGLVPARRDDGSSHRVKAFPRLIEAVSNYAINLNTHQAYDAFRQARARLAGQTRWLNGFDLAETLSAYSQRGMEYVHDLRAIIRINRLTDFDRISLENPA